MHIFFFFKYWQYTHIFGFSLPLTSPSVIFILWMNKHTFLYYCICACLCHTLSKCIFFNQIMPKISFAFTSINCRNLIGSYVTHSTRTKCRLSNDSSPKNSSWLEVGEINFFLKYEILRCYSNFCIIRIFHVAFPFCSCGNTA